ncbi:MAG: hypothetical protein CM1200mP29_07000 [Verrucomicrobiota bacterium]|nr:MAG: hypothetical protein CM1200mP29_07000 [Verrucomicrobiota bacterium]
MTVRDEEVDWTDYKLVFRKGSTRFLFFFCRDLKMTDWTAPFGWMK